MSPVDPLQNPVVRVESNEISQSALPDSGVQHIPTPVHSNHRKKRLFIGPALLLLLVATPLAVGAFMDHQKAEREKALLPKHRIVTL